MDLKRLEVWWKAFRFHFTSASFMPGILGGMIAWTADGKFLPGYFLLVILGLLLNHIALNMTDDYYDFRHLVDVFATDGKNPYTGGSGLLSSGLIQPQGWDALLSDRPYRPAWPREQVIAYIQEQAGIHFDPQVVQISLEMVEQQADVPVLSVEI